MDLSMKVGEARWRAMGWALVGAFLYTLFIASGRFVGSQSNPVQIVFMGNLVGAAMMAVVAALRFRSFRPLRTRRPGTHLARTVANVLAELCLISAPLFVAYDDATTISLTDGVVTMLLAALLLKERAGPVQWIAAMTCLLGAMVVARTDAAPVVSGAPEIGVALAAGGAVFAGIEMFFIKVLSENDDPIMIMLTVNVLGVLILVGPAIWAWEPITAGNLLWLIMIGPIVMAEEYCWIRAFQCARAIFVVPFGYASIPMAALLGAAFFNEHFGVQEMAGATLVIIGGAALAGLSEREAA